MKTLYALFSIIATIRWSNGSAAVGSPAGRLGSGSEFGLRMGAAAASTVSRPPERESHGSSVPTAAPAPARSTVRLVIPRTAPPAS